MKNFKSIFLLLLLILQQSFGQIDSLRIQTIVPGASYIINGKATGIKIIAEEITPLELRIVDTNSTFSDLYAFDSISDITIDGVIPTDIKDAVRIINSSFSSVSSITNEDFVLKVSKGLIPGHSTVDKFGENPEIDTGTVPEDLWEFGGIYNYDTFGTAPIMYISSSDADDDEPIKITGLDINGNEVAQEITLQGQTNVTLTTPLWRNYRLENEGDEDLEGVVYCHTDPTPTNGVPASISVRAIINNGNNQTLMSNYTIPKGKVGFLFRGELGMSRSQSSGAAQCAYYSRRVNKVFKVKKRFDITNQGSSVYQDSRSFPDVIPSLTDIKLRIEDVSDNNIGVFGTFDIMLVDETLFSTSYLQSIGQPGY